MQVAFHKIINLTNRAHELLPIVHASLERTTSCPCNIKSLINLMAVAVEHIKEGVSQITVELFH